MLDYNVRIGLVPLRRDCTPRPGQFNWEIAEERGRKTVAYIKEYYATENISFVDLKGVIDVEVLWSCDDVDKVVEHFRKEKAAEYKELQSSPLSAARRGYVDTIIQPADTRKYVIGAFEMLFTKREDRPMKKHGTV